MLRSARDLQGYSIYAADGSVGGVEAFFFDDETWRVRYFLAKAGGLLINREVLIAPEFVEDMDGELQILYTNLTKEQVKNSPALEMNRPVADQQEIVYHDYYGADPYWRSGWQTADPTVAPAYGGPPYLGMLGPFTEPTEDEVPREGRGDPHLRSTKEVAGYAIGATDGEVGHVEDFVVDDEQWAIRYVVVDTRNWLPGKKVLISPRWVSLTSWPDREVYLDLEKGEIKSAPEWDPDAPLERDYEIRLHEHYGRPPYWVYR